MRLVPMKSMLVKARAEGYAVGGFEFWSYDSARAVVETAWKFGMPVILQVGHLERDYMGGYPNAYKLASMAAEGSPYPVALHLDHAEDLEEVQKALEAGFTSVMIDASMKPFDKNVELTRKVVETAAQYGASVEAELGRLAGTEGNLKSGFNEACQTDPNQARKFVEETGIDALAVAIGTAHGFYEVVPEINIPRLMDIAKKVSIPLVLHGGSGTPDEAVSQTIRSGVAKVNICTEFISAFGRAYIRAQEEPGFKYNVCSLFGKAMDASRKLVARKLTLLSPLKERDFAKLL